MTNEVRAGANRVHIEFVPDVLGKYNPQDFGMATGSPIFPTIIVSGVMQFGGINGFPQGRGDTTLQYNDTLSWIHGRHSFKFGGEFRRFRNNNFNTGTGGVITFPTLTFGVSGADVDLYHFTISRAGSYIVLGEVFAGRIGSPLDAGLSLFRVQNNQLVLVTGNDNTLNNSPATNGMVSWSP